MEPLSLKEKLFTKIRAKFCWLLGHEYCDPPVPDDWCWWCGKDKDDEM